MDLEFLRDEVVLVFVLGVLTFYQLTKMNKQTLLSILVMVVFGWVGYRYLLDRSEKIQRQQKNLGEFFDQQGSWRKETPENHEIVATFPKKGFRFLKQNQGFVDIAKAVVICRMFDKARYSDLLLYLDKMQKIYMYILDGRYNCKPFVAIFLDMRDKVLENLYSMYFVVPPKAKHVYGLRPHEAIEHSIDAFLSLSEEMLAVLRSYSKKTAKIPHFPETNPQPADAPFDAIKSRVLP